MKKELVGIIVCMLFVGMSVSSAISVDTKSTTSNNQSEECKEYKEVSKSDLKDNICDWLYNFRRNIENLVNPIIKKALEEWDEGNYLKAKLIYLPAIPFVVLWMALYNISESLGCELVYLF